jgi:hypothetical protein
MHTNVAYRPQKPKNVHAYRRAAYICGKEPLCYTEQVFVRLLACVDRSTRHFLLSFDDKILTASKVLRVIFGFVLFIPLRYLIWVCLSTSPTVLTGSITYMKRCVYRCFHQMLIRGSNKGMRRVGYVVLWKRL